MRDLRAAIRNQPAAEHDYDWMPLHMPGSVQDYGVLVVADPQTRRVLFVSDNAAEMFDIPPTDILDPLRKFSRAGQAKAKIGDSPVTGAYDS